jgi:hypothetical protein
MEHLARTHRHHGYERGEAMGLKVDRLIEVS